MGKKAGKSKGKKGGKKTKVSRNVDEEEKSIPKVFVLKRGNPLPAVQDLVKDFRKVLSPNCALKLKEKKHNKLKDFVNIATNLGVTHLCAFHSTETANFMKVSRLPNGPTLNFKIHEFSLMRDVKGSQKRPYNSAKDYDFAPLLVLNGMTGKASHVKTAQEVVKNMFQPIDVRKFQMSANKRVAMMNYDEAKDEYEFRHYSIIQKQGGVSKGVNKLLRKRRKNDLSRSNDISDYVTNGGYASDSEVEDNVPVPLATKDNQNVAINLIEQGPRLKLKLFKIEEGVCTGNALYEQKIAKADGEYELQKERFEAQAELKKKHEQEKKERKQKKKDLRSRREEKLMKELKELQSDDEVDPDADADAEGDADEERQERSNKKKFNPFAWARKGNEKADVTVEMDDDEKPAANKSMKKRSKLAPSGKKGTKKKGMKKQRH